MATIRLFEQASHARVYSKYRPTYPKTVLDIISGYITRNGGGHELAVDIACGSGQSTFYLLESFQRCIGVDISEAQISEAQKKCEQQGYGKNIHFMVGNGIETPVEAASADVITIAQAWHWMCNNLEELYSECKRILKPNGCLVVYGYGNVQVVNNDSSKSLVTDFYSKTLQGCWHKERSHIDNEYAEVNLPFGNIERHDIEMTKTTTLSDFIGYVSSWSGYQKYCEVNPGNKVLEELHGQLMELCSSAKSDNVYLKTRFPVFLILGQKNKFL